MHDLTGLHSVYTHWRGIEVMFHVSTLLPYEKNDPQKLQRKRHVGNDIVCVVFLEADSTDFSPACIKSHFLHTFILVQVSPKSRKKPTKYEVSATARNLLVSFCRLKTVESDEISYFSVKPLNNFLFIDQ